MENSQRGVTIVELMVVILIVAILSGLAIPTFREYTRNSRVTALQNDLVTALGMARSEALRRSLPVTVCAAGNVGGTTCAATTAGWLSFGWIVFTDNSGASGAIDAGVNGDEILQFWDAPGGNVTLAASALWVQYAPTGTATVSSGGTPATFDLAWPSCTGKRKRHLTVWLVGSPQAETRSCP